MKKEPHTPLAHKDHTKNCGCARNEAAAEFICECGAFYTIEVRSFVRFVCYDCQRRVKKPYTREPNAKHEPKTPAN